MILEKYKQSNLFIIFFLLYFFREKQGEFFLKSLKLGIYLDAEEFRNLGQSLRKIELAWGNLSEILPCFMTHENEKEAVKCRHCTPPLPAWARANHSPSLAASLITTALRTGSHTTKPHFSPRSFNNKPSGVGRAACAAACPGDCQCVIDLSLRKLRMADLSSKAKEPISINSPQKQSPSVKSVSVQTDVSSPPLLGRSGRPGSAAKTENKTNDKTHEDRTDRQDKTDKTKHDSRLSPTSFITRASISGVLPKPEIEAPGTPEYIVVDEADEDEVSSTISPLSTRVVRRKRKILTQFVPDYSYEIDSQAVPYSPSPPLFSDEEGVPMGNIPPMQSLDNEISSPSIIQATPKRRRMFFKSTNKLV